MPHVEFPKVPADAEEAHGADEERYVTLFQNMLEGLAYCRMIYEGEEAVDFEYLEVNPAFERLTGMKEVVGKRVSELIPELRHTNPELFKIYDAVARTGEPARLETYVEQLGIWFDLSVYRPREGHFVAVFDNITPRKRVEEALRASQEHFKTASRVGGVGTFDYDFVANRITQSLVLRQMDGIAEGRPIDPADLVGRLHPDDRAGYLARLEQAKDPMGDGRLMHEHRLVQTDGSHRWHRVQGQVLFAGTGSARHAERMVGTVLDFTENKRLEEQLIRAQRMEAIGTLAGGIAHDLNNILTPILVAVGLLRQNAQSVQDEGLLALVERESERGAAIIRQLLTYSRGLGGERTAVQLRHLIDEMASIIRETFPREIVLRANLQRDLWPVMGDATQLHQVLMNLCVNARDAMPGGGRLTLSAQNMEMGELERRTWPEAKPGPYLMVAVGDTGCGIAPEVLPRIFDPFFTTKGQGKGTGLGLSTVFGIIRGLGGFMVVESQVRLGSVFKIFLPAAPVAAVSSGAAGVRRPAAGNGELILLVDDEGGIRDAIRLTLEKNGYRVLTASNGAEALIAFSRVRAEVGLLFTDLMMPVMDGVSLVRAIRGVAPDLAIIAATGLEAADQIGVLDSLGVREVLSKPFLMDRVLEAVERVLRKPDGAA